MDHLYEMLPFYLPLSIKAHEGLAFGFLECIYGSSLLAGGEDGVKCCV